MGWGVSSVAVTASASQDSGGRQRTVRGKGRRPESLLSPSLFHIPLFAVRSQSTQFRSPSPPFFHVGYLEQVDLEEEKDEQEARAIEEFDSGDADAQMVPHLLEKLSAPGRAPSYYCGGLEILTQALAGCECPRGRRSHHFLSSLSRNLFALVSPLHWFTYFTAPWLNGPSGAKVK